MMRTIVLLAALSLAACEANTKSKQVSTGDHGAVFVDSGVPSPPEKSAEIAPPARSRPAFSTVPPDTKFEFERSGCTDECSDLEVGLDAEGVVNGRETEKRISDDEVLALLNAFARADFMYSDPKEFDSCEKGAVELRLLMRVGGHENEVRFSQACSSATAKKFKALAEDMEEFSAPRSEH